MNTAEQAFTLDPALWCGKTFPEHSVQTKAQTLAQSSKKRSKSCAKKPPLFLSLNADGQTPDALPIWQENGALLGAFSMHSFGESPKEERGSHLSQILEDSPHPKYYLSAKACAGILNRADRRGKILPPKLREALERQSGLFAFRVTGSTEPKPQAVTEKDGQRESATPSTPLTAPLSQSFPSICETPPETPQAATPAGGDR